MLTIYNVSLYYCANKVTGANKRFDFFTKSLQEIDDVKAVVIVRKGEEPKWASDVITIPRFDNLPSVIRRLLHFMYLRFTLRKLKGIIINDFMPIPINESKNQIFYQLVHDIRNFTDYNRAPLKKLAKYFQKLQWRNTGRILTVSEYTKNQLIELCNIPAENISVSYNGIEELSRVNRVRDIDFLYIATFEKRKNHLNLIKAFKKYVTDINPAAKMYLVGRDLGYRYLIDNLILEYNLCDNINIIDSMPENELIQLYERSYYFITPSLYEGFGMPIIEAMYYGCKVLCSDISVFHEVANKYADYFNPHDYNSIFSALTKAQRLDDDLSQLNYVKDNFIWSAIARDFLLTATRH